MTSEIIEYMTHNRSKYKTSLPYQIEKNCNSIITNGMNFNEIIEDPKKTIDILANEARPQENNLKHIEIKRLLRCYNTQSIKDLNAELTIK